MAERNILNRNNIKRNEIIKMGRSIYCGEMYDHVYDMDNYIIDISGDKKDGLCVVYCSSSGLYYPNTKDEFKRVFIDHQDRFEWRNHRIRGAAKTIWIRDITKEFYVKGISSRINNIDKLIGFLKEQVNGYELITVGSSGGGYIAALLGCVLNAKKVYCFSGFFNLNIIDQDTWPLIFELGNFDEYNKWYRIDKLIEKSVTEIFYFYPCLLQDDCKQASFVEKLENVRTFCFKSSIHGIPFRDKFHIPVLNRVLNLPQERLRKLHSHYNKKYISEIGWAFKVFLK